MQRFLSILLPLLLSLFFTACSTRNVEPSNYIPSSKETTYQFFSSLDHDDYGRPVFKNPLLFRPTEANVKFYIVQYNSNLPVSYFIIQTTAIDGDYSNVMDIIYSDTAEGFKGGLEFTKAALQSNNSGNHPDVQAAYLLVSLGAPVIGAVGGFVYGIVHSSAEFVSQTHDKLFVESEEGVILYTRLAYDKQERLIYLHEYNNTRKRVLLRVYDYNDSEIIPCRVRFKNADKQRLFLEETSCVEPRLAVF